MDYQSKIEELAQLGLTRKEIAQGLNLSRGYVNKLVVRFGIHVKSAPSGPKPTKHRETHCRRCRKEITNRKNYVFCSMHCCNQYLWDCSKDVIEREQKVDSPTKARRYLIEKIGHHCSICHATKWRGEDIPLILDHIDGNPYDNALHNLRMICPNCDAQLPTYKGRNIGKGRHIRRVRYKLGKSF